MRETDRTVECSAGREQASRSLSCMVLRKQGRALLCLVLLSNQYLRSAQAVRRQRACRKDGFSLHLVLAPLVISWCLKVVRHLQDRFLRKNCVNDAWTSTPCTRRERSPKSKGEEEFCTTLPRTLIAIIGRCSRSILECEYYPPPHSWRWKHAVQYWYWEISRNRLRRMNCSSSSYSPRMASTPSLV